MKRKIDLHKIHKMVISPLPEDKILSLSKLKRNADTILTHSHSLTPFDVSRKEAFSKHCGKRRKCWSPAFSPFPTMFSTLSKTNYHLCYIYVTCECFQFGLGKIFVVWE